MSSLLLLPFLLHSTPGHCWMRQTTPQHSLCEDLQSFPVTSPKVVRSLAPRYLCHMHAWPLPGPVLWSGNPVVSKQTKPVSLFYIFVLLFVSAVSHIIHQGCSPHPPRPSFYHLLCEPPSCHLGQVSDSPPCSCTLHILWCCCLCPLNAACMCIASCQSGII